MARVLAFDTSQPWCTICLSKNNEIVFSDSEFMPNRHSELLVPKITEALKSKELTLKDLDYIITTTGPGSFTGLRIGLATAQGLALALSKPSIGVNVFNAYAECIDTPTNILVTIESQKENIYCQLLSSSRAPIKEAISLNPADLQTYVGNTPYVMTGSACKNEAINLDSLKELTRIVELSPLEIIQKLCLLAPEIASNDTYSLVPEYIIPPLK